MVRTPLVVRGSLRAVLGLNSPVALVRDSALRVARESASDMVVGGELLEYLVSGRSLDEIDVVIEVMFHAIEQVAVVHGGYIFF